MIRALALRALLVASLLGAYVYGWSPYGRTATSRAGAVALQRAIATTSAAWSVRVGPEGHRLTLQSSSESRSVGWTAPAGVRFLLPALGVALLAPRRPYWLWLWGGHLVLGALGIALLCLGVATGEVWFVLYDGLTQYLVDAFSLGVAAWAVVVEYNLAPSSWADPTDA
jgi:hypothetical protein